MFKHGILRRYPMVFASKAGGQACPYKFRCLGCGHFRSDPSYLPELKFYLQQLLADRERIQAATDIED